MRKRTVRRARGEAGQCSTMGGAGRLGRSPPALLLWLTLNFACILSLRLGWKAAVLVPGMGMLHACAPKCLFDLEKQSTGTNTIVVNLFRWAWTYGEEEKLFEQKTIWANAFKVHFNVFRLEISVVRRQDNEPFWSLSLAKWEKYLQIRWRGRYMPLTYRLETLQVFCLSVTERSLSNHRGSDGHLGCHRFLWTYLFS